MDPFCLDSEAVRSVHDMKIQTLCSLLESQAQLGSSRAIEMYIYISLMVFEQSGSIAHIEKGVAVAEAWVSATSDESHDHARRLEIFDLMSAKAYERKWLLEDVPFLERSTEIQTPEAREGTLKESHALSTHATKLLKQFQQHGQSEDLELAIQTGERALSIIPIGHFGMGETISNVAIMYGRRFEQNGAQRDIDCAIKMADLAVMMLPRTGAPDSKRFERLVNLGSWLARRYELCGDLPDLRRAIEVAGQALAAALNPVQESAILTNMGNLLDSRYDRFGAVTDLDDAVTAAERALSNIPDKHPDKAIFQLNLMGRFKTRFLELGTSRDLDNAIELGKEIVRGTPKQHSRYRSRLSNFVELLSCRYDRTKDPRDLNHALELAESIVEDAFSVDENQMRHYLMIYSGLLCSRFEDSGSIDDIDCAISFAEEVVAKTPSENLDHTRRLVILSTFLSRRYEKTKALVDINRAIDVCLLATTRTLSQNVDKCGFFNNLGEWYLFRYEMTKDPEDNDKALLAFKTGLENINGQPMWQIQLCQRAADILLERSEWTEAAVLLEKAIRALPLLSPRSLENLDKQELLRKVNGLASRAVAAALNAGNDAGQVLELLEMGRGIISGLLLEMRTDISELKQTHPGVHDEFQQCRDRLDVPIGRRHAQKDEYIKASTVRDRISQRREIGSRFDIVIAKIRALPGFGRFLLPPSAAEMIATADQGPIIVMNMNYYRCDVFLIESHQIRALALPDLTVDQVEKELGGPESTQVSLKALKWLWDVAAHPVLTALGFHGTPSSSLWPHVWWICTGSLTRVPIHAAGDHSKLTQQDTVLDRVMSSYASSVKALIYTRRRLVRTSEGPVLKHAVVVSMRETPGMSSSLLRYAEDEAHAVKLLCSSLLLEPLEPSRRKNEVITALRGCKIFHFAGHGESHPLDPSKSSLLLEDWENDPLTVEDLRDCQLQDGAPFLGFLSACSTSRNKADNLTDEGIHLVSACQLAGFRHIVGTLWEVSDKHCVDIAKTVYETLRTEGMTDLAVCRGLHRALTNLRNHEMRPPSTDPQSPSQKNKEGKTNMPAVTREPLEPGEQSNRDSALALSLDLQEIEVEIASASDSLPGRSIRNLKLLDSKLQMKTAKKTLYWVPYVHFGV